MEILAPESCDLLSVGLLESPPEELDAVEVWPICCVPYHLDFVLL